MTVSLLNLRTAYNENRFRFRPHNEYPNTELIVKCQENRDDLTTREDFRFIGQITGFEVFKTEAFGPVYITATDTYF